MNDWRIKPPGFGGGASPGRERAPRMTGESGSAWQRSAGRVPDTSSLFRVAAAFSPVQFSGTPWVIEPHGPIRIRIKLPRPTRPAVPAPLKSLVLFLLYDGDSYELEKFYHNRIQDLDAASGEVVHLVEVGHPEQSGKLFRELTALALGNRWAQKEATRFEELMRRSLDHDRRREVMREIVTLLQIPFSGLPCLAAPVKGTGHTAVWRSIERDWFTSDLGRLAFSQGLKEWSSSDRMKTFVGTPMRTEERAEGIAATLQELDRLVRVRLHDSRSAKKRSRFCEVEGWAASHDVAILSVRKESGEAWYRRQPLKLTRLEFALLYELASQPEAVHAHVDLHRRAGFGAESQADPSGWVRDYKSKILKKLRHACGTQSASREEVDRLLDSPPKTLRLNLPRAVIFHSE